MGALHIPYIQTKLTQKATKILSKKLHHPVTIEGVDISWLDTAILDKVCVQNEKKDTLLYIQETYIDFQLLSLLSSQTVIENVFLVNPTIYVQHEKEHDKLNINYLKDLIIQAFSQEHADLQKEEKTDFRILSTTIHEGAFEYFHPTKDSIYHINAKKNFNHHHFDVDHIFTKLDNFYLANDTLAFNIIHLSVHEKNHDFMIKDFNTHFLYCNKALVFDSLDAYIENSYLGNKVQFKYNAPSNFGHFMDSIRLDIEFANTAIASEDLGYFVPSLEHLKDRWTLSGKVKGKVSNLKMRDLLLQFGQQSKINGDLTLIGLPNFKETFMQIAVENSCLTPQDIEQYVSEEQYNIAKVFGRTNFSTKLTGFSTNFVTDGQFYTEIGEIDTDLNFNISDNPDESTYNGRLKTLNFHLGEFLHYDKLGELDMQGSIKGQGFKIETAKINLDATIDRVGFNEYDYQNIYTDSAYFDNNSFSGELYIKDPNLDAHIDGNFSLDGNNSVFNINTEVQTANLLDLKLSKEDIRFKINSSTLVFSGLDVDSIQGKGFLEGTKVFYNEDSLELGFFIISTKLTENNGKEMSISSEYLKAEVEGNFVFKDTYEELLNTFHEYSSPLMERKKDFISSKVHDENHQIFYSFDLYDINPLIRLSKKDIYVSRGSKVFGQFTYGNEHNLQVQALVDSFAFNEFSGKQNVIFLDSHKSSQDTTLEANMNVINDVFYVSEKPQAENLNLETLWKDDKILFSSQVDHYQKNNGANIVGELGLYNDKITLHLSESEIKIDTIHWNFFPNNNIVFYKDSVVFKDFFMGHEDQSFGLVGSTGKDSTHQLDFSIENLSLQQLKPVTGADLEGTLNATVNLNRLENSDSLEGTINVYDFATQGINVGNIEGTWNWDDSLKHVYSSTKIRRNNKLVFSLKGHYDTKDSINGLHYTSKFERMPLDIFEEVLTGQISETKGNIDGKIYISGNLENPYFSGKPMLHSKSLTVDYLQTNYRFNSPLVFKGDSILFPSFTLYDTKEQTKVQVSGGIKHKLFTNFESDLHLHLNKSLVLDTKPDDNQLFYGKVFATGDIDLTGPFDNLSISSKELKTEKGSELFIPLNSEETISTKEYISFVNRANTSSTTSTTPVNQEVDIDLKGLLVDFNLFITPETYFEIIFDEQAGEKIKANGEGNIQLVVDTRGDFKMSGIYKINKGSYNFTLANFINKRFDISSDSKITWNGSPYDGTLDIQAKYEQNASLIPLLTNVDSTFLQNNIAVRKPVRTSVLLNLDGSLLSPQIGFGIEIPNYPRYFEVEQAVQNLFSTINFNEQELNKQVFSLIVLKQFSALDEFSLDLSSSSASTVSELLSNQFSSWVSQFDENLQVDIDLTGFDEEANNTFRVRLSYDILDGKIRITRDGDINNIDDENQLANIFGEWTIEYLITDDGKIKMRAYNRMQNNLVTSGTNNTSMIFGAGITHTADFDNLGELFRRNKNKQEVDNLSFLGDTITTLPNDTNHIILPDTVNFPIDTNKVIQPVDSTQLPKQ
ncbi:MAG: hypothetical protein GY827_08805 [Cytophagales bacterium]|nr:hypothetical protein [Cytophagales bacterium]